MEYDSHCDNFICQSCDKLLMGRYGHEIFEFDDAGDIELYVTKDMFIYLNQHGFFKFLMKIYDERSGFPQRSNSFDLTHMYKHGKIIVSNRRNRLNVFQEVKNM